MKILMDSHIFLWALSEPEKLSEKQRLELESLSNIVYVSSISIAELMIKSSIGKLAIAFDPIEMISQSGFEQLDFKACDALLLKEMPYHHKDPFDRMLICQCLTNKLHIMSDDTQFSFYDCKLI